MQILTFSCHCGFMQCETAQSPESLQNLQVLDCNCSICKKKGFLHHIVSESNFVLKSPSSLSDLGCYTFQTHVAKHYFCPKCGICTFYKPRSNPDGWSVNMRCIVDECKVDYQVEKFDGENWEENAAAIKHLSE
ncbi:hypothetical protein NAEGRDRAFT_80881 [Naegleria gruberi]|uniref:CENP-V/GFA domain-containing protein n=1 Tax=Naegleria gruberi TaxID=5762 RepID=D2VQK2_NAEGR|nr:uncharacterized protein NAEGRDRAFT_80881 [Naegleria gruberi]EFC40964.1 hypothetical protein NAEGRDRAFT_80881 [Naegleria gruberi]|eukprot:XP_002673708.1 hypothetical protein NAEGRDRAFT_80881 [Naegleria gruberi strain NEG-M]